MFEPEAFEAAPAVSATSEGWLCLESFSAQPFLQHVVGRYSCVRSFYQVWAAARYLKCVVNRKS